jgi:hypothetical protein
MTKVCDSPRVEKGQLWENKKLGTQYEILAVATCCDNDKNNQQSIIYTGGEGGLYTRCRDEFLQKFVRVDVLPDASFKGEN